MQGELETMFLMEENLVQEGKVMQKVKFVCSTIIWTSHGLVTPPK